MSVVARRWFIFGLLLAPFLFIVVRIVQLQSGQWDILGPEPGKAITWFTGEWALYTFIATIAVSPLKRWFGWGWLLVHRRMLGLFAFFYASLHLLAYLAFLLAWEWGEIASELVERPYLTLGFLAWLLLVPLAMTSTKGWQRRLKRQWKKLHKLTYLIGVLIAIHYLLQIRASWFEPVLFAAIILVLLAARLQKHK